MLAAGFAPAPATLSASGLCWLDLARLRWSPHLELHQAKLTYRAIGSLTLLWGLKMVSLTGFAPVISCMRVRHVGWTTPQGRTCGESREICTPDLVYVTHLLWLAEL